MGTKKRRNYNHVLFSLKIRNYYIMISQVLRFSRDSVLPEIGIKMERVVSDEILSQR